MNLALLHDLRSTNRRKPVGSADSAHEAVRRVAPLRRRTTGSMPRRAIAGVALLGTLAACSGAGPSTTRQASIATVITPTTIAPTTTVTPPTTVTPTTIAPTTVAPTTTMAPPATVTRPSMLVDQFATVAGSRMHVRCVGSGATTVILIAGFGGSAEIWGAIETPIAMDARVCSYDRFGTGVSDPPATAQTFTSQAADLRTALRSLGEPGPYVVVGHSFGGAEAVAFASMFPGDVSGLLLLDASPTGWPDAVCAVPADGSDAARGFAETCAAFAADANPERLDAPAAFAEVAAIASLGALPMTVVTAAAHPYAGLDAGEVAHLTDVWDAGQHAWASLSSLGHVVTVTDTGHDIQLDQPDAVIDQIQQLLGSTR